jgi:hypothetical protein
MFLFRNSINHLLYFFFLISVICLDGADKHYANPKDQRVYEQLTLKIQRLEEERRVKTAKVRAKGYDSERERAYLEFINKRIDQSISKYKERGNAYFRKVGQVVPWQIEEGNNESLSRRGAFSPRTNSNVTITPKRSNVRESKLGSKTKEPLQAGGFSDLSNFSSSFSPLTNKEVAVKPDLNNVREKNSALRTTELQRDDIAEQLLLENEKIESSNQSKEITKVASSINADDNNLSRDLKSNKKFSDADKLRNVLNATAADKDANSFPLSGVIGIVFLLVSLFLFLSILKNLFVYSFFKKLGFLIISAIFLILGGITLIAVFIPSTESLIDDKNSIFMKERDSNPAKASQNIRALGNTLLARAVLDDDPELLVESIRQLEKAYTDNPNDRCSVIALADAYMEVDTVEYTAIALTLYESVLESFSDDELFAKIIDGYFLIGNLDVAFYLSTQRIQFCPKEKLKEAGMQLSYIAMISRKENKAIEVMQENMRGDTAFIKFYIAILEESAGDLSEALSILTQLINDSSTDPSLVDYAKVVKGRMKNEK